jgi:molybdopterin molybdotransferase
MSDNCASPGLLGVSDAVETMVSALTKPLQSSETIALQDSLNRVLANDVVSKLNVPPCDNSAMDGYALIASDLEKGDTLVEVGVIHAGDTYNSTLKSGQCLRIMTGAPIPAGADTVIMKEQTKTLDDHKVQFLVSKPKGNNVRKAGENIAIGTIVVAQGTRLNAAKISLLASLGEGEITVYKKLTVGILATGNELVLPGKPLSVGQIYESNRIALHALLIQFGAKVVDYGIVEDSAIATRAAFNKANEECDVVISSGGVSVGDADYVKEVLDELGEVGFWKVAIKPGKPFAFGRLSKAWFCGLPGNPVSSYVTCQQLVLPFLSALQNELPSQTKSIAAKLTADLKKKAGRMDFQRGFYRIDLEGNIFAQANGPQGSGVMSSVANANCYIVIPAEQGNLTKGDNVRIIPFEYLYN